MPDRQLANGLLLLGLACLIVPAVLDLMTMFWVKGQNGQAPMVLVAAAWLYWQRRDSFDWRSTSTQRLGGGLLLTTAVLLNAAGQALRFLQLEGFAIAIAGYGVCLLWSRHAYLRLLPINLLLLAVVPLPGSLADALLVPLKATLSNAVVTLLASLGYPVALNGVIISIGFHQLQVADACSGLWSMISLIVVGLLYELLIRSSRRRVALIFLALIAPIALLANFLRVLTLVLVVHHLGSAAEARVHDLAAILELGLALALFSLTHALLQRLLGQTEATA